jgi:hypothetical protein
MMKRFFNQMIERPAEAFLSCLEMLSQSVDERQRIDGMVSRMIHTLSRPPSCGCGCAVSTVGTASGIREEPGTSESSSGP